MYTPIGKSVHAISKQTLTFLFTFVEFLGIFFVAITKIVHSSQSFINRYCPIILIYRCSLFYFKNEILYGCLLNYSLSLSLAATL